MECSQVNERLPEYLNHTLRGPERLEMEAHWATCPACETEAEEIGALWTDLESVRTEAPSPEARVRFEAMLEAFSEGVARSQPKSPVQWRHAINRGLGKWWPRQPIWQVAAALVLMAASAMAGLRLQPEPEPPAENAALASLQQEVRSLQQLVALSMLDRRSASQRLQGVGWSSQIERPGEEVLNTLIDTMNYDPNINVRLAAVGALGQFSQEPMVREGVVQALPTQQSPLIQVALIDLLVQLREERSVPILEMLAADELVDATVRERAEWGLEQLG